MESFDPDLFWDQVRASGDCWVWVGRRMPSGYGQVAGYSFTETYAHRLSWTMANGPIPAGLFVLHHCDNPPCVNPEHLFLGTAKDNAQDRDRKGRDAKSRGYVPSIPRDTKPACVHGHVFTPENTLRWGEKRRCRTCIAAHHRKWSAVRLAERHAAKVAA